jgi:hypothetical protein
MSRFLKLAAVPLLSLALLAGCTDANKIPAEAAMKAAESALASLGAEAAQYAPEGVAAVQKSFASAKELVAKQDYKGALEAASAIPAKAKEVLAAATAKKDELMKAWTEATGKLPDMVAAIKSRLGILQQAKKLPAGLDKAALAKAQEGVAAVESGLAKATEQLKSGKLAEAIAGAKELQAKGMEVMKSIGMQ